MRYGTAHSDRQAVAAAELKGLLGMPQAVLTRSSRSTVGKIIHGLQVRRIHLWRRLPDGDFS
jgi:hypothetical protein